MTGSDQVYADALRILADRPICGWGVGSFFEIYNRLHRPPWLTYPYPDAHSSLLNAVVELGMAGGALFLAAVGLVCRPFRTLVHPTRAWAVVSLTGATMPLLSDNFLTIPGVVVPVALVLLVVATRPDDGQPAPPGNGNAWGMTAVVALFVVHLTCTLQPRPEAGERLSRAVRNALGAEADAAAWCIEDEVSRLRISSAASEGPTRNIMELRALLRNDLNGSGTLAAKSLVMPGERDGATRFLVDDAGTIYGTHRVDRTHDATAIMFAGRHERWFGALTLPSDGEGRTAGVLGLDDPVASFFWRVHAFLDPDRGLANQNN